MICTLIHELGHMFAARLRGIPASLPRFMGPVGAFVTHAHGTQGENAWIALTGPLAGAGAAGVIVLAGWMLGDFEVLTAGYWAFGITLLNMIPFGPFDGNRAAPYVRREVMLGIVICAVAGAAFFSDFGTPGALEAKAGVARGGLPFLGISLLAITILTLMRFSA